MPFKKLLSTGERKKIALFTSVREENVITAQDVGNIYEIPLRLNRQGVDEILVKKLALDADPAKLEMWHEVVEAEKKIRESGDNVLTVALVGKYVAHTDAYKSVNEALYHAGLKNLVEVRVAYIDSIRLETGDTSPLDGAAAILVPGGFGNRGIAGKINAARYARERQVPYFGICLGMQIGVIEFARNVAGLEDAHSTEFDSHTRHPVVGLVTEWRTDTGGVERRDADSDFGGTMRLGSQACVLEEDSLALGQYGREKISERHRHRYEFNNHYLRNLQDAGLRITGRSEDGNLVEIIEIPDHPWFLGCQFHPEFKSTPRLGHPLFISFIKAGMEYAGKCGSKVPLESAG